MATDWYQKNNFLAVCILLALCIGTGFSLTTPAFPYTYECNDVPTALDSYQGDCAAELNNLTVIATSQASVPNRDICYAAYEILKCLADQVTINDPSHTSICLSIMTSVSGDVYSMMLAMNIPENLITSFNGIDCATDYDDFLYGASSTTPFYGWASSTTPSYGWAWSTTPTYGWAWSTTPTYGWTPPAFGYSSECTDLVTTSAYYSSNCYAELTNITNIVVQITIDPSSVTGEDICFAIFELLECLANQVTAYDYSQASTCLSMMTSASTSPSSVLIALNISDPSLSVVIDNIDCESDYISLMSDYTAVTPSTTYTYPTTTNTMSSSGSFGIDLDPCMNISVAVTDHYSNCIQPLLALISPQNETTLCTAVLEIFECLANQITLYGSLDSYYDCLDYMISSNGNITDLLNTAAGFSVSVHSDVTTAAANMNCSFNTSTSTSTPTTTISSSMTTDMTTTSSTTGVMADYSEAIPCHNDTECEDIFSLYYCGTAGYCRLNTPDDTCSLTLDCGDSLVDCIGGHCLPIKKNCTEDEDCYSYPFKYCKNDTEHGHPDFQGTGLCVPYPCNVVSDCPLAITDPYLDCEEGIVCGCLPGYEEKGGACIRILGSPCSIDNECNLDDAYCSSQTCGCSFTESGDSCLMASTDMISPSPTTDMPMSSTAAPYSGDTNCSSIGEVVLAIANDATMAAAFEPLLNVSSQDEFCTTFDQSLNDVSTMLQPSDPDDCYQQMQGVAYGSASQILALLPPLGIALPTAVLGYASSAMSCLNSTTTATTTTPTTTTTTDATTTTATTSTTTTTPVTGQDCSDVILIGNSILSTGIAYACQIHFARILTAVSLDEYCSNFTGGLKCIAPLVKPADETQCLKEMKTEIEQNSTALLDYVTGSVLGIPLPQHIQAFALDSSNCALETPNRAVVCSVDRHCTDLWLNLVCDSSQICRKLTDDSCSSDTDCKHALLGCVEGSICTPVIKECAPDCVGEPLTFCETTAELGYSSGYCKPETCVDNSTCTLPNSYCTADGACDCAPGFYFIVDECTDTFVTAVTYEVGLRYQSGLPQVQHKCVISDTLVDGFTYQAQWFRSGAPNQALKTMPVTSATSSADIVLNDNDIPPVYLLNDEMHCSVSVWDASGVEVQAAVASPTLKAVEVLNTTVALPRGEKKKICFSLGLPVACQAGEACSFSVLAYDSSDDNSCSAMSLAISGNGTCGCKATPKTENDVTLANGWLPYTPETFCCYVTTKGEFKRTFEAAKALTLKTAYSDSSRAADPHVEGDLTQAVSVAVTDPLAGYSAIPSCKFFSNGYVWTFDNRYISLRGGSMTARYTAYRHTEKNTEIQFSMKQSESNNQAEITSFYLRSGKSIAKIEHSNTVHEAGTKQKSSDGTDKFRFFKQTNNLFALRLPGGTELNTYTESEYGFSLSGVIFASPSDAGKTTGLCGNLDGVPTNDPGDGDITTHIATDDYEDETVRNSLTDWTNASLKCVCTSPYTVSQQICSVQDDEVCSGGLIAPQQGVEYNRELTRRRRSVVEGLDYELFSERGKLSSMLKEMAEAHPIAKRDAASCDTALAAMCSELGNTNLFSTADRDRIVNVQCGGETNTTVDWARLSCTTIQLVAVQHYYRDNMTMVNNPEYQHICVGGCLNNGTCVNGACQCASGFEGDSCHLNITETPVVISEQEVTWNLDPPQCFNITTYDGIGSSATCLVKLFTATIQVDNKITFTQTSFEIVVFLAINTYEGQCCPSSTGRRRRSTGTTNSQYQLQVSNDGQTYSDPIVLTTLDTTCQNITTFPNGTNYVELLSGYCFIDGVCYNESDTNPSLSCQYCTTSYNLFNWNDTCVYNTADNKDDGLPGYAIALIVIAVVAVIVGLAAGVYILVLKKKLYHGIGDIFNRGLVREPTNAKFITVRKDADIAAPWKEPEGVPGMAEPVWQPQQ